MGVARSAGVAGWIRDVTKACDGVDVTDGEFVTVASGIKLKLLVIPAEIQPCGISIAKNEIE
jgi:hypothetical protein